MSFHTSRSSIRQGRSSLQLPVSSDSYIGSCWSPYSWFPMLRGPEKHFTNKLLFASPRVTSYPKSTFPERLTNPWEITIQLLKSWVFFPVETEHGSEHSSVCAVQLLTAHFVLAYKSLIRLRPIDIIFLRFF